MWKGGDLTVLNFGPYSDVDEQGFHLTAPVLLITSTLAYEEVLLQW